MTRLEKAMLVGLLLAALAVGVVLAWMVRAGWMALRSWQG